ncbi:succinate---hydroxymethylglutarate CoA-transferase [Entomortierella parvispora]|uniref:Succinate---hydroxymethylglutarate CoA-transferase n=1 Tax=Entomortierella parvispora TaxID=205924 RepID=A0A9P3HHT4_9FUNG|nr:succinate---hydroxymethylglutarate CoA-transferase [Entomortierella parvispora]
MMQASSSSVLGLTARRTATSLLSRNCTMPLRTTALMDVRSISLQTRLFSYTARARDHQRSTAGSETVPQHPQKDAKVGNNENTIESLLSKTHQGRATSTGQSSEANEQPAAPLDGIRVLDLTRVLAGPYCTQLLGDLGAEVIKIENPKGGDDTRAWGPPFAKNADPTDLTGQESAYFLGVNRNKKSITVNIRSEEGRKLVQDLATKVDVLVENYVPGKLDEMGLGYETLRALNPRLIYTSITGYGQTGPYRNRPGYDVMIEAEAGLMYITGEENGTPVKVGVAVTDLTTGLYAHGAIMAAILARYKTGRGQHIDCSLLDSQVVTLANIGSSYLIAGQEAKRMGTSHPSIVPYQVLPSRDSHIMIGAGNDGQFKILCSVMGLEHLPEMAEYKTNKDRVRNRKELIQILTQKLKTKDNEVWLKALEGRGIPFAPINNIAQTFAHPQVVARDMIQEIDHPKAGKIKVAGIPVKYSDTKPSIRIPPPMLGQHTDEILRDVLGYDEERIKVLKEKKAV